MENKKINLKAFFPVSIGKKLKETKDFYLKYFDFTVVFDSDWYVHLVSSKGTQIAILMPNLENQPKVFRKAYGGEGVIYSFEVEDAKAEYEKAKKLGLSIIFELKDEEWGQRHFAIQDPNGMKIDIVEHLNLK